MTPVTREEYEEWAQHPITKQLRKVLTENREEWKEGLVADLYTTPDVIRGMCQAVQKVIEFEYEDIYNA